MASNEELFQLLRDLQGRVDSSREFITEQFLEVKKDISDVKDYVHTRVCPLEDLVLKHDTLLKHIKSVGAWILGLLPVSGLVAWISGLIK